MAFERIEHNSSAEEKEKRWNAIEREVDRITDRLGKPIDQGIRETVIALKANGFGTTSSCEGHLDWGSGYPWVDVESALAESLLKDARYQELREKARRFARKEGVLTHGEKEEYNKIVSAEIEENEKEYERLRHALNEFYAVDAERRTATQKDHVRLTIEKGPWNQARLKAVAPSGPEDERRERGVGLLSPVKKRHIEEGQKEMARFTEFLRHRFFAST